MCCRECAFKQWPKTLQEEATVLCPFVVTRVSHTCCVCVLSLCPCLCSWTSSDHGICCASCLMFGWSGGCWSGFGVPSCPSPCLYLCPVLCLSLAPSHVPSPSRVPSPAPSPSLPPLYAFSPVPPSHARGLLCPS